MEEQLENNSSLPSGEECTSSDEQISEAPPQAEDGGNELDTVRRELDSKIDEIKALNEKYLRLAAEFDNYKRRAQRDQSDGIRFANEKLFRDLLPIIDNLERAIHSRG
jgi:molecular chaperone GrpE